MTQKYLGITPYDETGKFEFAGRTVETWVLYDRINRNDYTVYYAASGEGKSSLIRAGLIPILYRRDYVPIYIVFEDKELCDATSIDKIIEDRLGKIAKVSYEQSDLSKKRFNADQSQILQNHLWWKLRNYCFKNEEKDVELKPLFIFDQFEEVFTKANYEWTDSFFRWLEEMSMDYVPDSMRQDVDSLGIEIPTQKNFKALFSFRTEYLGDLDYWCVQKHFIPSLQDNRMCLKPLTIRGAKDIINLNKDVLGTYTDQILRGCSDHSTTKLNDEQPCVYALILSVVCQTLSVKSDKERIALLKELNINQDNAIDNILLEFYKDKLKEAGLDHVKDVQIISDIEDALVNENGKRNRKDTNESSIKPLAKFIQPLCNIGLLKIIGEKEVDNTKVKTIEFPHDRLCKAIDASRKERQGKRNWQLKRQSEWMQFGIMAGIVAIIAFLWNTMMELEEIEVDLKTLMQVDLNKVKRLIAEYPEGIIPAVLMLLLLFVVPIQVFSLSRKSVGWIIGGLVGSVIGSIIIASGYFYYADINYSNKLIQFIGLLLFIICIAFSVFFIVKINNARKKGITYKKDEEYTAVWPLYGGICIFLCYIFYECLTRLNIGISEPIDSAWCVVVIPIFFALTIWDFLNMKADKQKLNKQKTFTCFALFVVGLVILFIINSVPKLLFLRIPFLRNKYYNDAIAFWFDVKQNAGFPISVISLLVCLTAVGYIFYNTISKSKYYYLSISKKVGAIIITNTIIIITYILNLGYNPLCISPSIVCHVASWRSVIVCSKDSLGNKEYLGIVDPLCGEEIIPCCINISVEYDTLLTKGEAPFKNDFIVKRKCISSPFENSEEGNTDMSLIVDRLADSISGKFTANDVYEEYLYKTHKRTLKNSLNINDSINISAAKLYYELRNNNLTYLLTGKKYGIKDLAYIETLDSLQSIAFNDELKRLKDGAYNNFEDKDLVGFYRELSRTMLISQIRDRVSQKDVSSLFTLSRTFPLVFFNHVNGVGFEYSCDFSASINSTISTKNVYKITSKDLFNNRLSSWYQLFDVLCKNDVAYNNKSFQNKVTKEVWSKIEPIFLECDQTARKMLKYLEGKPYSESNEEQIRGLKKIGSTISKLQSEMNIIDDDNLNIADARFSEITRKAINLSLTLINSNTNGHYNNAFENTIQNLILVSRVRGREIKEFTEPFETYRKNKSDFYENIVRAEVKCYDMLSKDIELIKHNTEELSKIYKLNMKLQKDLEDAQKLLEEAKKTE